MPLVGKRDRSCFDHCRQSAAILSLPPEHAPTPQRPPLRLACDPANRLADSRAARVPPPWSSPAARRSYPSAANRRRGRPPHRSSQIGNGHENRLRPLGAAASRNISTIVLIAGQFRRKRGDLASRTSNTRAGGRPTVYSPARLVTFLHFLRLAHFAVRRSSGQTTKSDSFRTWPSFGPAASRKWRPLRMELSSFNRAG